MVPTKAGLLSQNLHYPLSEESSPVAMHYLRSREVAGCCYTYSLKTPIIKQKSYKNLNKGKDKNIKLGKFKLNNS